MTSLGAMFICRTVTLFTVLFVFATVPETKVLVQERMNTVRMLMRRWKGVGDVHVRSRGRSRTFGGGTATTFLHSYNLF